VIDPQTYLEVVPVWDKCPYQLNATVTTGMTIADVISA
jgi:hypothetical protein